MSGKGKIEIAFSDFVESVADKAGLNINKRGPDLVRVGFDMGGGRKQIVTVLPLGLDVKSNLIVGFLSPALQLQPGQDLGQKTANDLLRENAKFAHGAWAIAKIQGAEYLVAFDTQIAQTMQPEEFAGSVQAMAAVADQMEKKLGTDLY